MFIPNRPVLVMPHHDQDAQDMSCPFSALLMIGSRRPLPVLVWFMPFTGFMAIANPFDD